MATKNPRQKNSKTTKESSVQAYLEIAEIRDDVLVLKDGSMRSVIMTSSLNFDLKSQAEQEAIIASYQNFLNSLNFPLQILVRSKKLVLDNYLYLIEERHKNETSEIIKNQVAQYKEFIESLLEVSQIMDKSFYVIVPYFPGSIEAGVKKISPLQVLGSALNPTWAQKKKEEEFQLNKSKLLERIELVIGELSGLGLRAAQLNTQDLVQLFYEIYNLETAQREKLIDVGEITTDVVKKD